MENEKACPLRTAAGVVAQGASQGCGVLPEGWSHCLGPVCAWFDAARECCAVLALVRGLRIIGK